MTPKDRVLVEIFRGIKPEPISLFSSNCCAPIAIDVGLNSPLFSSYVPQELKVQFIVHLLKYIPVWHLPHMKEKLLINHGYNLEQKNIKQKSHKIVRR